MLCRRCLHRLVLGQGPLSRPSASRRNFTNAHAVRSEPTPTPTSSTIPAYSTPFTNSPSASPSSAAKAPQPKSKTKAGTELRGLSYVKGQGNLVAGEDGEYPDWLWGLLDEGRKGKNSETGAAGDVFAKSKKERRIALKAARKAALDPASRMVKIPYDRQTIDLPVAEAQDGRVELNGAGGERGWEKAQRAREELTQVMRSGRRKAIKESNFLKSMR